MYLLQELRQKYVPRCVILLECQVKFEGGNGVRIALYPGEPSAHVVGLETDE